MKKQYIGLVACLSLLILSCGKEDSDSNSTNARGWGSRAGSFGARVTSVETESVEKSSIALEVRAYGTVQAQDIVSIIPQVSNRITKMYVDLGDEVERGQILAKIYDVPFKGQVEGAKAQIRQAQVAVKRDSAEYKRQQQIFESGYGSEFDLQNAEAVYLNSIGQLDAARANLAQSQENLDNTEIRSPVNGVITARFAEEGNLSTNGQAIFEIANLVGYESRIFVPVQDWSRIKIGQEVKLRASNDNQVSATGVVSRKSPQLDAITGLGEVVISLTETGPSIYPGVLTENIITIESKASAVVVPRSAIVEKVETVLNPESNSIDLKRSYSVFVAVGDSIAERRVLDLGIEQGELLEVLSGLSAGEKMIVTGQSGLTDGAKIRIAKGSNFSAPTTQELASETEEKTDATTSSQNQANATANTPPNREAIREMMQNMSPEERAKLRDMSREERRAFFAKKAAQSDSTLTN